MYKMKHLKDEKGITGIDITIAIIIITVFVAIIAYIAVLGKIINLFAAII